MIHEERRHDLDVLFMSSKRTLGTITIKSSRLAVQTYAPIKFTPACHTLPLTVYIASLPISRFVHMLHGTAQEGVFVMSALLSTIP